MYFFLIAQIILSDFLFLISQSEKCLHISAEKKKSHSVFISRKCISLQQLFNFMEVQSLFTLLDFHNTLHGVPSIVLELTREPM